MFKLIAEELRHHAPFTVFGAVTGIIIMLIFKNLPSKIAYNIFYVLHPTHVLLSALVTASMYSLHKAEKFKGKYSVIILLIVGYLGSVGIATLSDSVIPYLGESLLKLPNREVHLGFIEEWWLINPMALLGIAIAYFKPTTRFPHAGHVLISTWASLFHILMAIGGNLTWFSYAVVLLFLFLAVWFPCCLSDIVFPLFFVKEK